jgi:hypothetical protein
MNPVIVNTPGMQCGAALFLLVQMEKPLEAGR